jgi:Type II secretion system (T2SS), protein E, N-terminal domain
LSHFSRGHKAAAVPLRAAPGAESTSARRFGELLVAENVITSAQLDAALRLQSVARAYVPIGQVLLANKFITRRQLNTLLHRHGKRSRLGDVLVKAGRITLAQLDAALALQRKTPMPIGQALITLGAVNETMMRDALCTQLHVNFFDLDPINIDQKLTRLISPQYAARHLVVPLFRVGDILVVAVDDPSDLQIIERLEATLRLQIEIVTTTLAKLKAALHRLYGPPVEHDVDVFGRRNILVGPIRDHLVVELVERGLRGVSVVSFG